MGIRAVEALSKINIPDSVEIISDFAFLECTKLSRIEIPSSVKAIGISAFRRCSNLSEVIIASGATFIKDGAFAKCANITSLSLPNGISIAESAFSIDILHTGTEIRFYNPKDGSIDEPETTENDLPF